MNELNNNENNSQVATTSVVSTTPTSVPVQPVQESVNSPQPGVATTVPVAESAPVVQAPVTQAAVSSTSAPETVTNTSEVTSTESIKDESDGKLRFPLVVVLLLIVVVVFLFIYYFVLITPQNLFSKALKAQINGLTSELFVSGDEHKTVQYLIDSKFEATQDGYVNFLNGLEYKFNLSHDIKNGNYGLTVLSNIDTLNTAEKIEHNQNINSSFYYYDRSILYKFSENVLKTDTHGDSGENISDIMSLIRDVAYEAVDLIDVDKVERRIETKKIKDQSLLAIRFSTSFDNSEINRIWQTTIDNMLDNNMHPDFIKKLADNLDITEDQAKETVNSFKNINIDSKEIKLDYYLNLACNNLVAFELSIDNVKVLMSYLSGYYFLEVDTAGVDIDFDYNYKTSDFTGEIELNNKDTYSLVEFESIAKFNDLHEKVGNEFNVKFYDEKTKGSSEKKVNPYLTINSNVMCEYDKDLTFFDKTKVVPLENASVEDLEKLSYMINKIKYELFYMIGLNTMNRTEVTPRMFAENMLNSLGENIIGNESFGGNEIIDEFPDVEDNNNNIVE